MARSLRRLPLPFAHVLRHVESAVRVRAAVQDSGGAGKIKRTPGWHHPYGHKTIKTTGSSKICINFVAGGTRNIDYFDRPSIGLK